MTGRPLAVVCVSGGMDSAVTAALAAARPPPRVPPRQLRPAHRGEGARVLPRARRPLRAPSAGWSWTSRTCGRSAAAASPTRRSRCGRASRWTASCRRSYVPVPQRPPALGGRLLGRGARGAGHLRRAPSGRTPRAIPDCRPEFYRAFEEAVRLGTRPETSLRIVTPVISMTKAEIVRQGLALGVPFEMTWSCYQAEDAACGVCESCRLRLQGLRGGGGSRPHPLSHPRVRH